MILKSLYLYLNLLEYPRELTTPFGFQTRFVCNAVQRILRKERFHAQGFGRICVQGREHPRDGCTIASENAAVPEVKFDRERYESLAQGEHAEFFLHMLEEGILKCARYHVIPLKLLLSSMEEFRGGGYINEWVHKSRQFRNVALQARLKCEMTIDEFTLSLLVSRGGETLLDEAIMRTKPDEIIFAHQFKDVKCTGERLVVIDKWDREIYSVSLDDLTT